MKQEFLRNNSLPYLGIKHNVLIGLTIKGRAFDPKLDETTKEKNPDSWKLNPQMSRITLINF